MARKRGSKRRRSNIRKSTSFGYAPTRRVLNPVRSFHARRANVRVRSEIHKRLDARRDRRLRDSLSKASHLERRKMLAKKKLDAVNRQRLLLRAICKARRLRRKSLFFHKGIGKGIAGPRLRRMVAESIVRC